MLGLQKVGWIFSHPAREKGYDRMINLFSKFFNRTYNGCGNNVLWGIFC